MLDMQMTHLSYNIYNFSTDNMSSMRLIEAMFDQHRVLTVGDEMDADFAHLT